MSCVFCCGVVNDVVTNVKVDTAMYIYVFVLFFSDGNLFVTFFFPMLKTFFRECFLLLYVQEEDGFKQLHGIPCYFFRLEYLQDGTKKIVRKQQEQVEVKPIGIKHEGFICNTSANLEYSVVY